MLAGMVSVGGPCSLAQMCMCGPLQPRACAHALRRRSGPRTCTSPASPTAARPSSAQGGAPGARAFAGANSQGSWRGQSFAAALVQQQRLAAAEGL